MEAQRTKIAVSACTQYATNAKYVEVNSGRHSKVQVFPGMHALSPDEVDVYSSLAEKCQSARVTVMHNHCMSEQVHHPTPLVLVKQGTDYALRENRAWLRASASL